MPPCLASLHVQVFAVESPEFAKGDSEERHVNFRYVIYTVEMGRLMLQSWDGANWTTVWSPPGGQGRVWNRADVRLPDDAQALRFLGITRNGYESEVAVALAVDSLQTSNVSSTPTELPNYDTGFLLRDLSYQYPETVLFTIDLATEIKSLNNSPGYGGLQL